MVAPSDMMDGRVGAIRDALDNNGHTEIPIMSYAAKIRIRLLRPVPRGVRQRACFRAIVKATRWTRQTLVRRFGKLLLDIDENADIIMVKPALPYLDIIRMIRDRFDLPIAAYNVSGEYAMIEAGARLGWIDRERVMMETLLSIRRAGADMILTYFAKDAAKALNR